MTRSREMGLVRMAIILCTSPPWLPCFLTSEHPPYPSPLVK